MKFAPKITKTKRNRKFGLTQYQSDCLSAKYQTATLCKLLPELLGGSWVERREAKESWSRHDLAKRSHT